ncbi:MAG: carotenoid 1,2-hydratase [Magnetococcales bacterium]|nr:carotenoid 1,2-hydratase [Magnetococcales bacterium]
MASGGIRLNRRRVLQSLLLAGVGGCEVRQPEEGAASQFPSVAELLQSDAEGFERIDAVPDLVFPRDHGPHPSTRHEWWYLTATLKSAQGRIFGVQWSQFRLGLAPGTGQRFSPWASRQAWMCHVAMGEEGAGWFQAEQRLAREALGIAGGQADPLRVWMDDWQLGRTGGSDREPEMALSFRTRTMGASLQWVPLKPLVLQGEGGYSRKGDDPGNASCYYSLPRLQVSGTVIRGDESVAVQGLGWFDREWGSGALERGSGGWDWFALHLEDGRELMYYRLRRENGSISPWSAGVLIDQEGGVRSLSSDRVSLTPGLTWSSPESGRHYPVEWRFLCEDPPLDLLLKARFPNQELLFKPTTYWEGMVTAQSRGGEEPLYGEGFLELVGYRPT